MRSGTRKKDNLDPALIKDETVQCWLKAAEKGDAKAQYNLGISYYKGVGIPKDWSKALYWFKAAGEQGIVDALYMLGMMYQFGKGVVSDGKEAFRWYYKAAELGDAESQYRGGNSFFWVGALRKIPLQRLTGGEKRQSRDMLRQGIIWV